jgi:uncharacterized protein YdhG (YjbR/CyaY superfamily)
MMARGDGGDAVDAYIAGFPEPVRDRLEQLRETIRRGAPLAEETISYGVPTFTLNGNLVHFAGYARHTGFYPGAAGIAAFAKEIAGYKSAKGSVQFPHTKPLPLDLVARMVAFRVNEQLGKKRR